MKFNLKGQLKSLFGSFYKGIILLALIILFLFKQIFKFVLRWAILPKTLKTKLRSLGLSFYTKTLNLLDPKKKDKLDISRMSLIELSFQNITTRKKTIRSVVTIGGIMLGIGIIVFLVSVGYGLEELVVSRVASLEEMKQIDVTPQTGGRVKINDKSLSDFRNLPEVEMALPLIAVASKVTYNNSVSDIAAYGVTTEYLKQSAIQPTNGEIFESTEEASLARVNGIKNITNLDNSKDDWVELEGETNPDADLITTIVDISPEAKKEAVVNKAMLKVMGLQEGEAVGKKFTTTFVVVGNLLDETNAKIESTPTEYTITGVIAGEDSPFFYVAFLDLRTLGINNYSQVKVVTKDSEQLADSRRQIESMGFATSSVVDTVVQITSLFSRARVLLLVIGMVALLIGSLGMFNTLTISLLERTREVGLMKAMGMKSSEIQELFLTESIIMSTLGGTLGLIVGWLTGKLIGLILSIFTVSKGMGYIDISYVPMAFTLVILLLSFIVGILTGIYPARRAAKISALNALRYE